MDLFLCLIVLYALVILLSSTDSYTQDADYLIVLGSGLNNNAITPCLKQRCDRAISYLNRYKNTKTVLTGGFTNNSTVSEASVMREYLLSNGIEDNRILVENKAIDTVENIKFSLQLIDNSKKIVILSNNYHLFRAKMIARLYGVTCRGIGVKTQTLDLIKHLIFEEIFIIKNYLRVKKEESK